MRGVSKGCVGTSGELKLGSKQSEDREALQWSMTGVSDITIYGFYTPISERSHLSFCPTNCPGKTKFYICPNENVESNNRNRQEVLFSKSDGIKLM